MNITEGSFRFDFPPPWEVIAYDKTKFFRLLTRNFRKLRGIDLIAWDRSEGIFFIEIKDYRQDPEHARRAHSTGEFVQDMVEQIRSTLLGLIAAYRMNDIEVGPLAAHSLQRDKAWSIILLLEVPPGVFGDTPDLRRNLGLKLRQRLGFLHARVEVLNAEEMARHCHWEVSDA